MTRDRLRWGVLGTSRFARNRVIPALRCSDRVELVGIASRDIGRARDAADQLAIPRAYGSYAELVADDSVDVVYNPTANHLHVPLAIEAIRAGKHVLVEKPLALGSSEARMLAQEMGHHPGVVVAEAMMYRHHPQWRRARELVRDGALGDRIAVELTISYLLTDETNIRARREVGGGCLLDLGCYGVSIARFLFGGMPRRIAGSVEHDPRLGVDRVVAGVLEFDRGVATVLCSTRTPAYQRATIHGSEGRLVIEAPLSPPVDRPALLVKHGPAGVEEIALPICDQYTLQANAFCDAVRAGAGSEPAIEESIANLEIIERLAAAAREGTAGPGQGSA